MRLAALGIVLAFAAHADIVTLKNGRILNGTYLGGTPRQIKVEVGDQVETVDVSDVARIEFSGGSSPSRSEPRSDERPTLRRSGPTDDGPVSGPIMIQPDPSDPRTQSGAGGDDPGRPTLRRSDSSSASTAQSDDSGRPTLRRAAGSDSDTSAASTRSEATAPRSEADDGRPTLHRAPGSEPDKSVAANPAAGVQPAAPVIIPAPYSIVVRMIDPIDSAKAKEGQTFAASLDQAIAVDGRTVLNAGTEMTVKLVQAQQSGKFTGKTELTVSLWSVKVNGKDVPIDTQNITEASSSRGAQTAKVAGGAAAVGAIIGAVAGGGKGAAVGAGAGAAGGAAVQAATKGQHVKIASETLLTFVLEKPLTL